MNCKKSIAIIIFDITKHAGTERAVCNLSNLLAESQKYDVLIVSIHSTCGEAAYDINADIQIYHLGLPQYKNKITRIRSYKLLIRNVNKIIKEKNIDIILGTTHAINCVLFFLRKKVKTIACEHMDYMSTPLASRILRKITYSFLDAVVVLSTFSAKHYLLHKNLKIIPNSLSFLTEKKSELTNKIILAVGRLTYQKGFDLLINAISLIKNECNGWKVKIIGAGEDEAKLKNQIITLNLGNIVRICPPTNTIIHEYIEASIFVLSSRFEGLPMVMIEAQSCGLPIVSFNCPEGPAEIVHHNGDGLLVKNGDVEGLSKALLELMQNREGRIQFGEKALQSADKYNPENVFKLWDNLLEIL
jgi:glycosyltransferase involved in cell wall biosynthesis